MTLKSACASFPELVNCNVVKPPPEPPNARLPIVLLDCGRSVTTSDDAFPTTSNAHGPELNGGSVSILNV